MPHPVTGLYQTGNDVMPLPPRLRKAVKENRRPRAVAGDDVVDAHARFDVGHAVSAVGLVGQRSTSAKTCMAIW